MTKPHGIRGEVIVDLITTRTERVAPGTTLASDRGDLRVLASSPHQGKWIVQLEGVADRNAAESLRGTVLRAPAVADESDALWVHELVGAAVLDASGERLGVVESVEANPASDLLVLDSGGLIPLRFVTEHTPGRVVVDIPEGLLE